MPSPRPSNTTTTCNSASNASSRLNSSFSLNDELRSQQQVTATTTLLNANLLHYYARSSSADNAVTSEPTYHSRSIGVHHGRTEENSLLLDILDEALRIISLDDLLVDNNVAAAAQQEARQSSTTTTGFNGDDNNQ